MTKRNRIEQLKKDANLCLECPLRCGCISPVVSYGDIHSPIMIIAEAPGEYEDLYGCPLIGRSGQYLDNVLLELGVTRDNIYTTNIVKCRPNNNRTPSQDESLTCGKKWLDKEIEIIRPSVLLLLGNVALKYFFGISNSITRNRGKLLRYKNIDCIATFHPAAILRARDKELDQKSSLFYSDVYAAINLARAYNPLHNFNSGIKTDLFKNHKRRCAT